MSGPVGSSIDYVRVWDRTRSSIEAFDRYIADIQKFYLTIVMGIVGIAAGVAPDRPIAANAEMAAAICAIVIVFAAVFWGLETHYFGFLRVAASTAERLERELGLASRRWGVTSELTAFSNYGRFTKVVHHLFYVFPAGVAFLILAVVHVRYPVPWWHWSFTAVLGVVFLGALFVNLVVMPGRRRRFLGTL